MSRIGRAFWLKWTLASAAGWFASWFVVWLVAYSVIYSLGESAGFFIALAAAIGTLFGVTQRWFLRRQGYCFERWVLAHTLGWTLSCAVVWVPLADVDRITILGAVGGTLVGMIQWSSLRYEVRGAGWWVLANTVGWGLGFAGGVVLGPMFFVMPGAIVGAITGIPLVWLLRTVVSEAPAQETLVPVPVLTGAPEQKVCAPVSALAETEQELAIASHEQIARDFLSYWMAATAIGWTLAIAILWSLGWLVVWGLGAFCGPAMFGAWSGASVGIAQRYVLQKYDLTVDGWILANTVSWAMGEALGESLAWSIVPSLNGIVDGIVGGAIIGLAIGILVSVAQSFVLSTLVEPSMKWIAVSITGWTIAMALLWAVGEVAGQTLVGLACVTLIGAGVGVISGRALAQMLYPYK